MGDFELNVKGRKQVKTIKTLMAASMLCCTLSLCGCGGDTPGGSVDDTTSGGEPTPEISDDPNEVGKAMGDDYAKEQKK